MIEFIFIHVTISGLVNNEMIHILNLFECLREISIGLINKNEWKNIVWNELFNSNKYSNLHKKYFGYFEYLCEKELKNRIKEMIDNCYKYKEYLLLDVRDNLINLYCNYSIKNDDYVKLTDKNYYEYNKYLKDLFNYKNKDYLHYQDDTIIKVDNKS